MPRYFFDLDDHETSKDQGGTELQHSAAAKAEAVMFAGAYLRDHPELVWADQEVRVVVRDESRAVVFTVIVLGVEGC